jgi:hypothetical protein
MLLNMESGYHIVTMRVIWTSWAHVWRLRSLFLGMGYDRLNCFHCLPLARCRIFPSLFCWMCQSKSWASLALENISFKQSKINLSYIYEILRGMCPIGNHVWTFFTKTIFCGNIIDKYKFSYHFWKKIWPNFDIIVIIML